MKDNTMHCSNRIVAAAAFAGSLSMAGCGAEANPVPGGQAQAQSRDNVGIESVTGPLVLGAATRFFVPPPDPGAVQQIVSLFEHRDLKDAFNLLAMVGQGQAVWFDGGTPAAVRTSVKQTMHEAGLERSVPVLVAYNLPFRDCAQYSAGGAADTASYEAWIDAFAAGIGKGAAVVILEPDGLGIIPYNTTIYGAAEWCKPTVTDTLGNVTPAPGADPADRYAQLAYGLVSLATHAPNAKVYVDGTHSAWLGVGEAAYRINHLTSTATQTALTEGLPFNPQSVGFFLNVSNYQPTDQLTQFGTWVSDCITAATAGASWAAGHFDWCPSQYDPALDYAVDYSAAYEATVTTSLQNMMGGAPATTHFLIDTGRNGRGPENTAPYAAAPYNQPASVISALQSGNWCNAAGAGVGLRPSGNTGLPLLDAYVWVKIPGQSDGSCDIAGGARGWDYSQYNPWGITGDAQNHFDPLWGAVDPAAGAWFAAQALQLAQDASPPLGF
ncbi:MAG TPA: glycoside hydrolase family 6 protein [Polyangiaceae bacterium]|nr:glycoside hydrolase family 6 protein [Polyangiaceae bacterium]